MGFVKKYSDKLYMKQWGLGYLRADLADIIRTKKTGLRFEWMEPESKHVSHADPFLFRAADGRVHILFESVSSTSLDGKISLMICNAGMEPVLGKVILETKEHLSYPFVYRENGKLYVFPENALSGSLSCYEYEEKTNTLINRKEIIAAPLLDATILKKDNRYWLFATVLGDHYNSDLHIFYSNSLMGPYTAHAGNPVKSAMDGARPAGNFIEVDGEWYRPAQNCSNYYGESITIQKVTKLTTTEYREEEHMLVKPDPRDAFNYGLHTINAVDDLIIVDGQKGYFQPVQQLSRKLKNIFN